MGLKRWTRETGRNSTCRADTQSAVLAKDRLRPSPEYSSPRQLRQPPHPQAPGRTPRSRRLTDQDARFFTYTASVMPCSPGVSRRGGSGVWNRWRCSWAGRSARGLLREQVRGVRRERRGGEELRRASEGFGKELPPNLLVSGVICRESLGGCVHPRYHGGGALWCRAPA